MVVAWFETPHMFHHKPPGCVAEQLALLITMEAFSQMTRTAERPARVDAPAVEDCPLADRSPKTTSHTLTGQRCPRVLISKDSLPHFQDKMQT